MIILTENAALDQQTQNTQLGKTLVEVIKFGLVGILNTGVDFGAYYLLTRGITSLGDITLPAKMISYTLGIVNSYVLNKLWTFKDRRQVTAQNLVSFFAVNLLGLLLNAGVLAIGIHLFGLSEWVALVLATLASVCFNFPVSKNLIFKSRRRKTG